jgi:hypothetical protein
MCTRLKHLTEVKLSTYPSQVVDKNNADYIKYLNADEDIFNLFDSYEFTPETGFDILSNLFEDNLLARWKRLTLIERDSKHHHA